MSGHEQDTELRDSNPNASGPSGAAGEMGVSSERVGHTGPGQQSTDGVKDTSRRDDQDGDVPPEQSVGGEEPQPDGVDPAAGYPSLDPRSEDKPYKDA